MTLTRRMANLAQYFALHPKWVLGLTLTLTLIAAWAAQQLPVYTSRQALLPQDTEVAQRFNNYLRNFGAASDLIVVLEGAPRGELESFAHDLAGRLGAEPEIGRATARLDMTFFLNHAYLLLPNEGLDKLSALADNPIAIDGGLEHNLEKALSWSRESSPLAGADIELQAAEAGLNLAMFFLEQWQRWLFSETVPDNLDWSRLLANSSVSGMTDGYFASRDGEMLFVFVHPKNSSGDFEHLGPFVDKVKAVSGKLIAQTQAAGHTPPTVGLTGLPALEYEEYVGIRQDIQFVTLTSASLVALLIVLVVRSLRWAALIFIPMGIGVLWSLGLALISVGHLNMITAAFIAILFGLGADYGIFTTSRIAEERRAGKPLPEAIGTGIGSSFTAVLTAGGASFLIFGAISTVDFPGFSELGIIAATGVLMILLSTWLVQPALYALLPPKLGAGSRSKQGFSSSASTQSRAGIPRFLSLILVMSAVGSAVFGGLKGFATDFDYDVLAMLPEDSQAAYYQRRMVAESDIQPEVIIFTAQDMDEARRISREAEKLKTIAQTQSLAGLFPEDAGPRLRQAVSIGETFFRRDHRKQLAELAREGLSSRSFELVKAIVANGATIIDQAQEQAFSAGHVNLVESLENIREQLRSIAVQLDSDGESSRARSERFLRALISGAHDGLDIVAQWRQAQPLIPEELPSALRERFFAGDGSIAVYAFPAETVYDPDKLDALIQDVYGISPHATGFPTTHQAFAKAMVASFSRGTQLSLALCLLWILAATRSPLGFTLAAFPLLIGGGWMLGLMALGDIRYNYANIVALPLVMALAVDYGVWFNYRWRELKFHSPFQVSLTVGRAIGLAAGTSLAGLGAITLASYRGVASLGMSVTIGLLCCLTATLVVTPAIGQLLDYKRNK